MSTNGIPAHAEEVSLLDVYRTKKQPSKFAPLINAIVAVVSCPSCRAEFDRPAFGASIHCKCGLHMQATTSGFFIWREPAQQAAE